MTIQEQIENEMRKAAITGQTLDALFPPTDDELMAEVYNDADYWVGEAYDCVKKAAELCDNEPSTATVAGLKLLQSLITDLLGAGNE